MKRILILFFSLFIFFPTFSRAESTSLPKSLEKAYKSKLKELKKQKWEVFGTSLPIEIALLNHYERLNSLGDDAHEVIGVASRFRSKNVGRQQAIYHACVIYANEESSNLHGEVLKNVSIDDADSKSGYDNFMASYTKTVEKEIKGELKESFCIIRCLDSKKKDYEMLIYFIVDERKAEEIKKRALEEAKKQIDANNQ